MMQDKTNFIPMIRIKLLSIYVSMCIVFTTMRSIFDNTVVHQWTQFGCIVNKFSSLRLTLSSSLSLVLTRLSGFLKLKELKTGFIKKQWSTDGK